MNELQAIVHAARQAQAENCPMILATVVRVHGSAYRRPGARMLLTDAGWQAGSISGGCLEGDVERKAWWRTRSGEAVIVTYDSTLSGNDEESIAWGFGLGCNGIVEVLLERLEANSPACPVGFINACLRGGSSGVMATVITVSGELHDVTLGQRCFVSEAGAFAKHTTLIDPDLREQVERDAWRALEDGGSRSERYALPRGGAADVFIEVIHPPTPLVICGAGHDAAPLADFASRLGWSVTVVDPRPGITPRADRFPGASRTLACPATELAAHVPLDERTLAVVMSHNVALDTDLVGALLASEVNYIGVLGPRLRTERIIDDLQRRKAEPLSGLDRVHGPAGLDIGADNPETIALSILAEMQAVCAGRAGGELRLRTNPIHPPTADANVFAVTRDGSEPVHCSSTSIGIVASA